MPADFRIVIDELLGPGVGPQRNMGITPEEAALGWLPLGGAVPPAMPGRPVPLPGGGF
jgi:hypothetical protein